MTLIKELVLVAYITVCYLFGSFLATVLDYEGVDRWQTLLRTFLQ